MAAPIKARTRAERLGPTAAQSNRAGLNQALIKAEK
jgi:hypothetical protein